LDFDHFTYKGDFGMRYNNSICTVKDTHKTIKFRVVREG